ncbi:MAG: glutamate synthase subunit beta [Candidatus Margulisiibacteriota bacterium]
MGNPRGFLTVKRKTDGDRREQASRCMDCGIPFCHWACPVGNLIPEWNDLIYNRQWEKAVERLEATNNLPEITGRLCPAPCEYACVLSINDEAVTIRDDELAIVEAGFKNGWIVPRPPKKRTGKKVAVVGSGPAGLSCAAELNRLGHLVTVFEKDDRPGGLLRYGIPDKKLEKWILDRRLKIWEKEGVVFKAGIEIGQPADLLKDFDAVCWAVGAREPRDLKVPGRESEGIHFALDYLIRANRGEQKEARGKKVAVIGGGDTGADCVSVALDQGADSVVQLEILPQPPVSRDQTCPWPKFGRLYKTAHAKKLEQKWSVMTKEILKNGLRCVQVQLAGKHLKEIAGSEFEVEADLVILAMGFLRPPAPPEDKGIQVAGDARRGPSLIVWAIQEGRQAAEAIARVLSPVA